MGEHVGEADEGGLALRVIGVVALDDRRDSLRQAPATSKDAADQRVVDAELAALAMDALLRRAGVAVHLARVAGVGVHQHELADVVQQRGDHQAVAMLVAGLGGQAISSALGGDAVEAEALRSGVPDRRALEEVKGAGARREGLDGLRREQLDGVHDGLDLAAGLALDLVAEAQDGDHERDVGLDGRDDLAGRDTLLANDAQQAVTGLSERGERLERLERGRQTTAVAFVVASLDIGGRRVLARRGGCCWGHRVSGLHGHGRGWGPRPVYLPVIGSHGRMIEHQIEHLSGTLPPGGIRARRRRSCAGR